MDAQTVYLDLETHVVRAGLSGSALPDLVFQLRDSLTLAVLLMQDGERAEFGDGESVTSRLVVKKPTAPGSAPLLLAEAWTVEDTAGGAVYTFDLLCDSDLLRTALGQKKSLGVALQIEFTIEGEDHPHLSESFAAVIRNAYSLGDDDAIPEASGSAAQALLDASTVRYDKAQALSESEQLLVLDNLGFSFSATGMTLPNGKFIYYSDLS